MLGFVFAAVKKVLPVRRKAELSKPLGRRLDEDFVRITSENYKSNWNDNLKYLGARIDSMKTGDFSRENIFNLSESDEKILEKRREYLT